MGKKFLISEEEKNEIKSLYRSKGLLKEDSDPKNADSYPDGKNWSLQDWQTFYIALNKKWSDRNKARAQFLRYWEPLEQSWMDEPAQDEMDRDNSWFRLQGMWNEKEKRPFTQKEFEEASKSDRCVSGNCNNGKGFMEYKDGGKYSGDFKNGKANGKGVFIRSDETIYEGNFKDGQLNGKGLKTFPDGSQYEGDFKDGEENGKGVRTWRDGTEYEGDFVNGAFNGIGTFINSKGVKFTGDFVNFDPVGSDTKTLKNLSTQEEADQLMNQIANKESNTAETALEPPEESDSSSSTSTADVTDCAELFVEAEKQTTYNPANLAAGKVVIGKGNQGALVRAMQCYLNEKNKDLNLGLSPLKVDGIFGGKTKEMTVKFQQQFPDELKPDGIIGKNTYAKFGISS